MYSKIFFTTAVSAALLFGTSLMASAESESPELVYQKTKTWKLPHKPIDFVQSIDGEKIFFLTDNHQILIYEPTGTLKGTIPVEPGVTRIDTDVHGETILLLDSGQNSFTSVSFDFIVDIDLTDTPILGDVNAPVTITVFTNFQCPYCSQIEPLLTQVLSANKGKARIAFKYMPLRGRDIADKAALGCFAAERQGKFWEFHDAVFATENLTEERIEEIAAELKLDITRFKADMNAPATRQKIARDAQQAEAAGVRGTPTVFINGQRLKNRSPGGFQAMIDKAYAQNK